MKNQYDTIIIGGGPGGYTAALYCARAGLECLVLEKGSPGGQMSVTDKIDNYPGFPEGINGFELAIKMKEQAERFGAQTHIGCVTSVQLLGETKKVECTGGEYEAKTVIIASGSSPRRLGLDYESELVGRGISYCAVCDGMFFKNKTVAVVGGGNTAAADALYLANICKRVILIHRRNRLRATALYEKMIRSSERIEILWNTQVRSLIHNNVLTGLQLVRSDGEESEIACDGAFIAVGNTPESGLFAGQIDLNNQGFVVAGESTETSVPGVFAAGDVREKPLRQVATAVSDGAVAASFAESYIRRK